MSKTRTKFTPEVRERAVRMTQEARKEYPSLWSAIESIAPKVGCTPQTLNEWVRKHEVDNGTRDGVTTAEKERVKALERGTRPPQKEMRRFIDEHRQTFGVESICKTFQIAPSGYWKHAACQRNPALRSARAIADEQRVEQIQIVWDKNKRVYGADKVWKAMKREKLVVARCTVERLMRRLGLRGVMRGKVVRTTISDAKAPCPLDRVNRQFRAERPNQLWVSDFTYVSTWQGWLYVAFVVDVFARRIVGWRVSSSMRTDFVLDALEQALYARQPERDGSLVCHSDRGSQYVSIRYTERLAEAGIEPSVGSKGDSYDNALAETINGLYKTELIHRRAPWKTKESLELATLEWVSCPSVTFPLPKLKKITIGN
eukprot:gene14362-30568_t